MATLTIQIVSALGTTSKTLTFSGTDSQRIMAAYQAHKNQLGGPPATQQDMTNDLAQMNREFLRGLVLRKETVYPTAPEMT
jgi:hypothetical protein